MQIGFAEKFIDRYLEGGESSSIRAVFSAVEEDDSIRTNLLCPISGADGTNLSAIIRRRFIHPAQPEERAGSG